MAKSYVKWMIIYEDESMEIIEAQTILDAINNSEEPDSIYSIIQLR